MRRKGVVDSKWQCSNRMDLTVQMLSGVRWGTITYIGVESADLKGQPRSGSFLANHTELIPKGKQHPLCILQDLYDPWI